MIERCLTGWDYTRPVSSLNRDDLRKLATAAITGWVLWRAGSDDPQVRAELRADASASVASVSGPITNPLDG